ncbi:MAG: DUF1499 domain-containing protein [bacterium]
MGKLIGTSAILAALSALSYAGLTAGFRMDMISFANVMSALKLLTPALLGLGGLAVLLGAIGLFSGRAGTGLMAIIFGLMSLTAASGPMMMKMKAGKVPAIHDITTDVAYPPVFVELIDIRTADHASNPPEYDTNQSQLQLEAYPDIKTLSYDKDFETIYQAALEVVKEMGLKVVATEENAGRIEATATTSWWGFKDDVVIRVNRFATPITVDIRSKSRIGKSDLGANAERIETFMEKLEQKLS